MANDPTILQHFEGCIEAATGTGYNHIGARRGQEDTLGHGDGWWAIADGMGGHENGELASMIAMRAVSLTLGGTTTRDDLADAFQLAENNVLAIDSVNLYRSPGTTLTVAGVHPDRDRIVGAWCGDSPAMLWTPGRDEIEWLTDDHTNPLGHLTACVGMGMLRVDYFEIIAGRNQRLIIASDGINPLIEDGGYEIVPHLEAGPAAVLTAALERARDNVTFAVIDIDALVASV